MSDVCRELTPKRKRFADEYLCDLNGKQAAIRAGYSEKTAEIQASRLLSNDKVKEYVAAKMAEREKRTEITQDMVLKRWWEIANLDVNEIVEFRRAACPRCWPDGDLNDQINSECPICKGEGHGRVHVHDTRHLKSAARTVYNGVQVSKEGIKVLTLDRDKALENVARHLGMFKEKVELTGKDGGPILTKKIDNLTDEELLAIATGGGN